MARGCSALSRGCSALFSWAVRNPKPALACTGGCGVVLLVALIVLLNSLKSLGPEQQLLIIRDGGTRREVVNGPRTFLMDPGTSTEVRFAVRMTTHEYAVVKDMSTGMSRHEPGPDLFWLGAWDELVGVRSKIFLQARQYTRVVDKLQGTIRVELGPQLVMPNVHEVIPDGVQIAVPLKATESLIVLNRTSGKLRLVQETGFFIPEPMEKVVEVRAATLLREMDYAVVKHNMTGAFRHEEGPTLFYAGAYDEVVAIRRKIVLKKDEYVRLVDKRSGFARVVVGPSVVVPAPAEDGPGGKDHAIERAIIISGQNSVIIRNRTSGSKYDVTTEGMFTPGPYEEILEVRDATVLKTHDYAVVQNKLTGKYIHYEGPQRLFVGANEDLFKVLPKVILTRQEYVRLVDRRTGEEAVLQGPQTIVPDPNQCEKEYKSDCSIDKDTGVTIRADVAVLALNRTSGLKHLVLPESGVTLFVPGPYEEILEVRKANVLKSLEFAVVQNSLTGKYIHYPGPQQLFVGPYEELVKVLPKVVLQMQQYVRLVDHQSGEESVIAGPQTIVPLPEQCEKNYKQDCNMTVGQAVIMKADVSVLVLNRTSGIKQIIQADTWGEGTFIARPYEDILEVRQAVVLQQHEYAVVKDDLTGTYRHVLGPSLLHLNAMEGVVSVLRKVVLANFTYIRLVDELTGSERIVEGPTVFVPNTTEVSIKDDVRSKDHTEMVQHATLIDADHAGLVLNQATGEQRLVTKSGMWTPDPHEYLIEMRSLIRVMANEAVIVRDLDGTLHVYDGTGGGAGTVFFLQPRQVVVHMLWSAYGQPDVTGEATVTKVTVEKIDMRIQRTFFSYEVRTNDNVKLMLMGAVFWRVQNVTAMVLGTPDPSGDVWHHSRSSFMQAVSNVTFDAFMGSFNELAAVAYGHDIQGDFYTGRGVELLSMEVTRFEAVDADTKATLQKINEETTNQITLLKKQEGENAVKGAKMRADIELEKWQTEAELGLEEQKTELILKKTANKLIEQTSDAEGQAQPFAQHAKSFIGALNETGVSVPSGLELYRTLQQAGYQNKDTANLASGKATLFLTSQDVKLNIHDLNLGSNGSGDGEHRHDL